MNNFSHGPVDVTSGIFYRPKNSKKTLLKSIFKNMLRQLGVAYTDTCCGDTFQPVCNSNVVIPNNALSYVGSGTILANNQFILQQNCEEISIFLVNTVRVLPQTSHILNIVPIPGYSIVDVSTSAIGSSNPTNIADFSVSAIANPVNILFYNFNTDVNTDVTLNTFLTYKKI